MTHTQLRAFHHVALNKGFSRAARALNQSQPSVSDQVRRLEQAHDVLLFHRDGRQVRLTPAGEELFRLTQAYFEVETRIDALLEDRTASLRGTLRIMADSALHVAEAVGRFRQAHPEAVVSIRTGNTVEVLAFLREYRAEVGVVGVVGRPRPAADLDRVDLGASPIIAIARHGLAPGPSLTLAQALALPVIAREEGSRTRAALEQEAARRGLAFRPAMVVEGRDALAEIVASGAGIGFVSAAESGHDARLQKLILSDIDLAMSETVVTLAARRDVAVIRAFVKVLAQPAEAGIAGKRNKNS